MKIKRVTPIYFVEAIEAALPFWQKHLGYEKIVEVPHEGRIGFVLLQRDDSHVMLQTHASVAADLPTKEFEGLTSALYVDVASLDAALASINKAQVIVPERRTFYGAREIWVRDPAGVILGFAETT